MKADDRLSGVVLMGLAVAICLGASQLRIGTFKAPGAGFFPFIMGLVTGGLSLVLFLLGVRARNRGDQSAQPLWAVLGRKKIWFILFALMGYGLLLERLGFLLTTFVLFAFVLRAIEPQKWWICLVGGLAASLGSYALFYLALGVQLPRGLLGI